MFEPTTFHVPEGRPGGIAEARNERDAGNLFQVRGVADEHGVARPAGRGREESWSFNNHRFLSSYSPSTDNSPSRSSVGWARPKASSAVSVLRK
jgi:hypothetical protein